MWTQKIEYIDAEVVLPSPVKKQVWDGEKFVPITLYKIKGWPGMTAENWLLTSLDTQEHIETEDIGTTVKPETLL